MQTEFKERESRTNKPSNLSLFDSTNLILISNTVYIRCDFCQFLLRFLLGHDYDDSIKLANFNKLLFSACFTIQFLSYSGYFILSLLLNKKVRDVLISKLFPR